MLGTAAQVAWPPTPLSASDRVSCRAFCGRQRAGLLQDIHRVVRLCRAVLRSADCLADCNRPGPAGVRANSAGPACWWCATAAARCLGASRRRRGAWRRGITAPARALCSSCRCREKASCVALCVCCSGQTEELRDACKQWACSLVASTQSERAGTVHLYSAITT